MGCHDAKNEEVKIRSLSYVTECDNEDGFSFENKKFVWKKILPFFANISIFWVDKYFIVYIDYKENLFLYIDI